MSSRKKRNNDPAAAHASSRNLDGRRLRTVTEAKALAEYLAVKPEMEKREKEERRKRWEAVVAAAERQTEEVKEGKGKGRVDGKWVEEKEEGEAKMREAVIASVRAGMLKGLTEEQKVVLGVEGVEVLKAAGGSDESDEMDEDERDSEDEDAGEGSSSSKATTPPSGSERKVFGWDDEEDDDDLEEDEK